MLQAAQPTTVLPASGSAVLQPSVTVSSVPVPQVSAVTLLGLLTIISFVCNYCFWRSKILHTAQPTTVRPASESGLVQPSVIPESNERGYLISFQSVGNVVLQGFYAVCSRKTLFLINSHLQQMEGANTFQTLLLVMQGMMQQPAQLPPVSLKILLIILCGHTATPHC